MEDPLRTRLRSISADAPELADAVSVYDVVLPLVRDADVGAEPLPFTRGEAEAVLARGRILLGDGLPPFDGEAAARLLSTLAQALAANGSAAAAPLALALTERRVPAVPVLYAVARGDDVAVEEETRVFRLSRGLVVSLAQYAVRPAFRRWGADAMGLFPEEPRRDRGECWVCGEPALLAELRGPVQTRHLRCGRCGASWGYPRLACVHCGSEERSARGVLLPEGMAGISRVETCEACRGYVKTIVTNDPVPADLLAVLDLETLPLDFFARSRGYER